MATNQRSAHRFGRAGSPASAASWRGWANQPPEPWELIKNNELFPKGGLCFQTPAITEGQYWNDAAFEEFTCELFWEIGQNSFASTLDGDAEINLAAGVAAYGWE